MPTKEVVAKKLAKAHVKIDPGIKIVVRVLGADEDDQGAPVKLLEVNPETFASGIIPISLGAAPPEIPFPSVVIEVTEREYDKIRNQTLRLPNGWKLGDVLHSPIPPGR